MRKLLRILDDPPDFSLSLPLKYVKVHDKWDFRDIFNVSD
jgi:hypothetical protein